MRGAAGRVAGAVHAALGAEDASVRVAFPDGAGRLRVVAAAGPPPPVPRAVSSRRRHVFETGRAVAVPSDGGRTHAVLPLSVREEMLGVIELVAPAGMVHERRDDIVALVRESGALFKVPRERAASRRSIASTERLLALANRLNSAAGAVEAMSAFAEVSSRHLDVPVAVVRPDRAAAGWFLGAVEGLEPDRAADLRRDLRAVRVGVGRRRRSRELLRQLSSTFSRMTGSDARWVGVGDSIALVDASVAGHRFLLTAASMLEATLERIAGSNGHVRDVDVGLAWTAHELRGPLVGAKAALEYVLSLDDPAARLDVLRRTKTELERLTDVVDPLLRVSLGQGQLRVEPTDLVQIARQAISSASLDGADRRVTLFGPSRLPIYADAIQIRSALGNVIRNALAYSPAVSPVDVALQRQPAFATVTIRDRGPGISAPERGEIFNAFVRGSTSLHRNGVGLGLFIARRIIEAHEGRIWFESGRQGTAFYVHLPRRRRRGRQRLSS
jgi:signal transduction histidine kinase